MDYPYNLMARLFWTNDVWSLKFNWEELEKCILSLPGDEFHAIYLRFRRNYSFKDIGEEFESTASYGRHIVDYALRRLRRPEYLLKYMKEIQTKEDS